MEWLKSLFVEHSALQAVVVISLISTIGIALGRIRIFGISLGVAFIFFAGILAGHFGLSIDPAMLNYAESFGLIIFVYALGLQVGPGFFNSLRADGLRLMSPALAVVLLGTGLAVAMSYTLHVSMPDMSGILCGATTNTPALGAAQQALQQMGVDSSGAALSCRDLSAGRGGRHPGHRLHPQALRPPRRHAGAGRRTPEKRLHCQLPPD